MGNFFSKKLGNSRHRNEDEERDYDMTSSDKKEAQSSELLTDDVRNLNAKESELAESLKKGTRDDLETDADLLKQLGDVHRELGYLNRCTANFVNASALYNAALMRTDQVRCKQGIEESLKQNEVSFLSTIGVLSSTIPYNLKNEVRAKLNNIRKCVTPSANLLLNGFNEDLSKLLNSAEAKRVEVERDFVEKAKDLFSSVCKDMTSFIQYVMSLCIKLLGSAPQEYAAIGFGSLARGETTPYSDIEWGILVESEVEHLDYFRNLVRLFHLFVLNLGETDLRSLNILSLNDRETPGGDWFVDNVAQRGFEFDSAAPFACKTPLGRPDRPGKAGIELIRTPKHMAQVCEHETALKEGYNFARVLTVVVKIDGSQNADQLVNQFKTQRRAFKDNIKVKEKAFSEIKDLIAEYFPFLNFHHVDREEKPLHDIKKAMFRLPSLVISLFKTLYSIDADCPWDVLDEMSSIGVMSKDGAHNLKVAMSIVALLRLVMYSNKSQQSEVMSLLSGGKDVNGKVFYMGRYKPLIFRYYYTMMPFVESFYDISNVDELDSATVDSVYYNCSHLYTAFIELNTMSYREALGSFCRLHEDLMNTHKTNDQQISLCLHYMGYSYKQMGKLDLALQYQTNSLKTSRRLLSNEDHPDIADFLNNIGITYSEMGRLQLALQYKLDSLNMRKRLLTDEDHLSIAAVLNNIAVTYQNMGRLEFALKYHLNALDMTKRLLSDEDHTKIADCFNNIGNTYHEMGDYDLSLQYNINSLDMRKRLLCDEEHFDIAQSLDNIGTTYCKIGKQDLALQYHFDCPNMKKRLVSEENHRAIANSLGNIGVAYKELGDLSLALQYQQDSLDIKKMLHGDDHFDIAHSLANIGNIYCKMASINFALTYHIDALNMMKRLLGDEDHPNIADILSNIGNVYHEMSELVEALRYHLGSLDMMKRLVSNEDNDRIADCLSNIGNVYQEMGEPKLSLQYHLDALYMRKRLFDDEDHPDIEESLNNIGTTYHNIGNDELALQYFLLTDKDLSDMSDS